MLDVGCGLVISAGGGLGWMLDVGIGYTTKENREDHIAQS